MDIILERVSRMASADLAVAPSAAEAVAVAAPDDKAKEVAEKAFVVAKSDPQALKREAIFSDLRGPEGPLFHGGAYIREFFRNG